MKTCAVCGLEWDTHLSSKCPRCAARTKAYEPTPAQIRRACLRIQKTWSPTMRRQRQAEAYRSNRVEIDVLHDPHPEIFGI